VTRKRLALAGLVTLAILTRASHLAAVGDTPLMELSRVYVASDMHVFDQWARNIVAGDWLGRTVFHPLGRWQLEVAPLAKWKHWYGESPVFYKAPFYAYLVAVVRLACGQPMLPLVVLQMVASSIALLLLVLTAMRTLGWEAGAVAGLLFALYAPAIHYDAVMLRGPWIVLVALAVTWQLLRLRELPSTARAVGLGAALGLAMLVNEGFSILPLLVLPLLPWHDPRARWLRLAAASAGGMILVLTPLFLRNVLVGAPTFRLAVTGSTVYAVFNSRGSSPYFFDTQPPALTSILERADGALMPTVIASLRSFSGPGEAIGLYLGKLVTLVVPFESPDNCNFYYAALASPMLQVLPGYGVLLALAGVGLVLARPRWRQALVWLPAALALLTSLLLTLPLSRYRATFAVFLIPFAGLAGASWLEALRQRRWLRAAWMTAGAVALGATAILLQRQVVFAHLRMDAIRYRPAEFALSAQVYAERHELASAARELMLLARLNPLLSEKVGAYLLLARLAARDGSGPVARAALAGASRIGGRDGIALLEVGDAYLRLLHDKEAARASYTRAQALDRSGRLRAILGQRLRALEPKGSFP